MGVRLRKSIRLGGGARLNLGLGGVSTSVGIPGLRVGIGSKRGWVSAGIPGTGLSFVTTSSGPGRGRRGRSQGYATALRMPVDPVSLLPRPGLLASRAERRFHEGLLAYFAGDHARALASFAEASSSDSRNVSDDLFAGVCALAIGDQRAAIRWLEPVVGSDVPLPDALMRRYLPPDAFALAFRVSLTDLVIAEVPFSSAGAAVCLAELYQREGRLEDAIGLMQQMADADAAVKLQLCDLLYDANDFEGVLDIAANVENTDDVALATIHLRAKALANLGMVDQAAAQLSAALRRTAGRNRELLREIRYNRGEAYELLGQPAKARQDFDRLYAEDPSYRDVRERLRS